MQGAGDRLAAWQVFNVLQLLSLYTPDFQLLLGAHQAGPCCAQLPMQAPAALSALARLQCC